MPSKLTTVLVISAKNAVNAALVTLGPVALWSKEFNFHNRSGLAHVATTLLSAVVAREAIIWIPKLLAWSQS